MSGKDFLLEIGCEELPADSLESLSLSLEKTLIDTFKKNHIEFQSAQRFATPRRLAVFISKLNEHQPDKKIERMGPLLEQAFSKDGSPTLACLGFARSCGISIDELKTHETSKGSRVYCVIEQPGEKTIHLLPELINSAISQLPLPESMRWGNHREKFVRPVHWVLLLYGHDLVDAHILGKKTVGETFGHRFHHPQKLSIDRPENYSLKLYSHGYVIANFQERKNLIIKEIKQLTQKDHQAIIDNALLNEVTGLVEWPVALEGKFDPAFLGVPEEALISSMQTHQKCFPVKDAHGHLMPYFILISNIDSKNPAVVIKGNERVINARLSDAAFFYSQDKKQTLESRLPRLEGVIFQKKLGSLKDKSKRMSQLAAFIANAIGTNAEISKRAALLSKCDLISEMVFEFPTLQGTMGYYYALHDKENEQCALAIKEHYLPRFSKDELPSSEISCTLALADRLDTLIGILGIHLAPSGDKDPYALRRAALGIIRILIEKKCPLDLMEVLEQAKNAYQPSLPNDEVVNQAFLFIMNRLKAWYLERNVSTEIFEAVMACHPTIPLDFHYRIEAVKKFQTLPESSALAAANKRVSNILKKVKYDLPKKADANLFEHDAEHKLSDLLQSHKKMQNALYQDANYTEALSQLSELKTPVDDFFDHVMVMVDDKKIRDNRLALLASLRQLFTQIADIALLP